MQGEGITSALCTDRLSYLLLEFSQVVGQAAFLQGRDPLDVSKVQAPDTQEDTVIIIIYVAVTLQNAFSSHSGLR